MQWKEMIKTGGGKPSKALELLATGDIMSPQKAERIGLVTKRVPLGEWMPTVKEMAMKLIKGPTVAIKI